MIRNLRRIPNEVGPREFLDYLKQVAGRSSPGIVETHRLLHRRFPLSSEQVWGRGEREPVTPVVQSRLPQVPIPPGRWRRSQWSTDSVASTATLNLIANGDAVDIGVTWSKGDGRIAGFVARRHARRAIRRDRRSPPPQLDARRLPSVVMGRAVIWLNETQTWATTFEVLLHEMAHVLLGHLTGWSTLRNRSVYVASRAHLPRAAREVEAGAVSFLVSRRRGVEPIHGAETTEAESLLKRWFILAYLLRDLPHVDLLHVAAVADILSAWCEEPPESVAVTLLDLLGGDPLPDRVTEAVLDALARSSGGASESDRLRGSSLFDLDFPSRRSVNQEAPLYAPRPGACRPPSE